MLKPFAVASVVFALASSLCAQTIYPPPQQAWFITTYGSPFEAYQSAQSSAMLLGPQNAVVTTVPSATSGRYHYLVITYQNAAPVPAGSPFAWQEYADISAAVRAYASAQGPAKGLMTMRNGVTLVFWRQCPCMNDITPDETR